jgi:hypothetical protein
MKIIVSQQNKKLITEFYLPKPLLLKEGKRREEREVYKYTIDRAEDFLVAVDTFLKKSNNELTSIKNAELEFIDVGVLTERIIRSIIVGLNFS